jgi:hypothetical protein
VQVRTSRNIFFPHKATATLDHAIFFSNCFKKRREHTVPPASAIEAEHAAVKAAEKQAELAAVAALKAEQQRVAAAITQGKLLAEKESNARVSAEAAASALAASRLQSDAEVEARAVAAAITRVKHDSEVQSLNERQLQVSECRILPYIFVTNAVFQCLSAGDGVVENC